MPSPSIEEADSSNGYESHQQPYSDLDNYAAHTTPDDYDCHERTPLLDNNHADRHMQKRGRSRERFKPRLLSRSSSVASTYRATKLSLWRMSRSQKIIMVTTSLVDFLSYLSVSIMAPFFPEEALKKDVSDTLSGWIFGCSPLVIFLISPFIGKLLPHTGVKFLFISGLFMFSGCTILFGTLTYVSVDNGNEVFVTLAFLLQVFRSIGVSATSTASFVLCIQAFPDNVSTVFGLGELCVGLGLVIGPGLGGLLYGLDGFYLPFVSIGALSMACLPVMMYALPSAVPVPESKKEDHVPIRKILCSPDAVIICLTITSSTYVWAILDPTLEPFLRKFSLSPEIIGVIFLVMALVYAMSSPIGGWLADKVDDPRPIIIIGFLFLAVGCLLIGPSPLLGLDQTFSELWLIIVSLVILGASYSFTSVPTFDMLFTLAQDRGFADETRTYGMVAGIWMSMYSLGDFIGPSLGGVLSDNIGFEMMCTYSAGLCLLMSLIVTISWTWSLSCCKKCIKHRGATSDFVYESFQNNSCYGSVTT